ncbi:hypothetical protein [Chryseobacterium vrystaatense]|uniref:Uncharacterized protein n=1 Tax=Chryseobacterium vrystaatense TaxID=307480 RepID=A0A1M4Z9P1_9FLAO|nr:hypothetical protein [Chryseobacterium vrystaatense]SHF14517.1 hypothetical protein SAMN02787073_1522 [Chryseobacterium vrystaatense]
MMEISEDLLFQSVKEIITPSRAKVFRIEDFTLLLNYISEAIQNSWNYRDLKRQINSLAYERVPEHREPPVENIHSILKDLSVFEFSGLLPDQKKQYLLKPIPSLPSKRRRMKRNTDQGRIHFELVQNNNKQP